MEERRKEIEKFELERKEAIIAKNKERDLRLINQRKNSRSNMEFAFGSSAPRMMEPRVDSGSGYWVEEGRRGLARHNYTECQDAGLCVLCTTTSTSPALGHPAVDC